MAAMARFKAKLGECSISRPDPKAMERLVVHFSRQLELAAGNDVDPGNKIRVWLGVGIAAMGLDGSCFGWRDDRASAHTSAGSCLRAHNALVRHAFENRDRPDT